MQIRHLLQEGLKYKVKKICTFGSGGGGGGSSLLHTESQSSTLNKTTD